MGDADSIRLILDVIGTLGRYKDLAPSAMETIALASYDHGGKFKHVEVPLRGVNGNTMVVVGTVREALLKAGATPDELSTFCRTALSNDYEHAMVTVLDWVTVVDRRPDVDKNDAFRALMNLAKETR